MPRLRPVGAWPKRRPGDSLAPSITDDCNAVTTGLRNAAARRQCQMVARKCEWSIPMGLAGDPAPGASRRRVPGRLQGVATAPTRQAQRPDPCATPDVREGFGAGEELPRTANAAPWIDRRDGLSRLSSDLRAELVNDGLSARVPAGVQVFEPGQSAHRTSSPTTFSMMSVPL